MLSLSRPLLVHEREGWALNVVMRSGVADDDVDCVVEVPGAEFENAGGVGSTPGRLCLSAGRLALGMTEEKAIRFPTDKYTGSVGVGTTLQAKVLECLIGLRQCACHCSQVFKPRISSVAPRKTDRVSDQMSLLASHGLKSLLSRPGQYEQDFASVAFGGASLDEFGADQGIDDLGYRGFADAQKTCDLTGYLPTSLMQEAENLYLGGRERRLGHAFNGSPVQNMTDRPSEDEHRLNQFISRVRIQAKFRRQGSCLPSRRLRGTRGYHQ